MKKFVAITFLISLLLPAISFAQEPKFYPGFVKVEELTCPVTVAPATKQVVTNVPVWILGCSYSLLDATSVIKIKDAAVPTDAADAVRIGGLTPVLRMGEENTSGTIQFTYPLYCARGIVLEATGAVVHIQYLTETNRRKNLK